MKKEFCLLLVFMSLAPFSSLYSAASRASARKRLQTRLIRRKCAGETAILDAAAQGKTVFLRKLLDASDSSSLQKYLAIKDPQGMSMLDHAATECQYNTARMLLTFYGSDEILRPRKGLVDRTLIDIGQILANGGPFGKRHVQMLDLLKEHLTGPQVFISEEEEKMMHEEVEEFAPPTQAEAAFMRQMRGATFENAAAPKKKKKRKKRKKKKRS